MRAPIAIAALSVCLIISVCLSGCDPQLTAQERALVATIALDSAERAAAWDVAKPMIVAKDPAESPSVNHFIANQSDSLHALATGLASLQAAIANGSNLSQNLRDSLIQEADTAAARAADLRAMMPHLTADASTLTFLGAHQAALNNEAGLLGQLKTLLIADAAPRKKITTTPAK